MNFSPDAPADFAGLLAVSQEICRMRMAEKAPSDAPPYCAVVPKEKEDLLAPKVGIKDITSKIKENDLPLDEVMRAIDRVAKKQQKQAQAEIQEADQTEAQGDS